MNINGERVTLRAIERSDKDLLLEMINDEDLEHALGGWSYPVSEAEQEAWILSQENNNRMLRCAISEHNTQKTVGTVSMSTIDFKNGTAEIHVKIAKEYRSKGYGLEAINLITNYCFNELRLHCIYANINAYNVSSQRVFEKAGFKKEGELRDRIYKRGKFHNIYSFSLINGETYGDW